MGSNSERETSETKTKNTIETEGTETETVAEAWSQSSLNDEDARQHRGWLVLVWASVAPTPPEKPERGERAFATLADGELVLRRERGGEVVARVNLEGCAVRLCRAPGKWEEALDGTRENPANAASNASNVTEGQTKNSRRHGFGAEKRWWKRLPIVLSHPTRALHRGHKVLWCYALSDTAKEAWTVALYTSLTGDACGASAHAKSSALAATSRARSLARDVENFTKWSRERRASRTKDASDAPDVSDVGWSSGGAAGAAINALGSRIFFDMQRSPDEMKKVTEQLAGLCSGIPDLPRFLGPISVSDVKLGESTPQVLAARLPPAAKPGTSAAPWDGGVLAGRGACAAAELEVEFAGVAEMTLTTHLDLFVYAEMMAEADESDEESRESPSDDASVEYAVPSSSGSVVARTVSAGFDPEERIRRLKSVAKKNASYLIGAVARKMAGVPISMTVKIKRLAGTTRVWIPPPPGDRLWFGFVGDPELDMEATPSFGQIGIKWHGLAERISRMITKQLLKEIHAALVLPNAGNLILDPLTPFLDVPELSAKELLELGKNSRASVDSQNASGALRAETVRPVDSKLDAKTFHTPSASPVESSSVEATPVEGCLVEDALRELRISGGSEDEAEEAVAAMVDSFLSVGSTAEEDAADGGSAVAGSRSGDGRGDERTTSLVPSPGVSSAVAISRDSRDADSEDEKRPRKTRAGEDERVSRVSPRRPVGGDAALDFRFGKPFPNERGGGTGSSRSEADSTPASRDARSVPEDALSEPRNVLMGFSRFAAGFAAKAERAKAELKKNAASVRRGVTRGGMKGGLEAAKSIAARTAKEKQPTTQ